MSPLTILTADDISVAMHVAERSRLIYHLAEMALERFSHLLVWSRNLLS
jgi:hypothetical protein